MGATMKKLITMLTVTVLVLAGCAPTTGTKNLNDIDTLTIAIAPTNNPEVVQEAADLWTEQLTPIFADMGYTFELDIIVAADASAITEGVNSGQIDVGFVPASNYVIAKEKYPETINVLMQGTRYDRQANGDVDKNTTANASDSTLYVNTEVYNELGMETWTNEDYAKWVTSGEADIAVSSYTSPAAYIWPINFLLDNSQDPNSVNWVKVDNNFTAIQQVADGNADATFSYFGVNQDVINTGNENYANINDTTTIAIQNVGQVRVPNDVAIVSAEFDQESQDAIYTAFETMASTEEGSAALNKAYGWVGVTRVYDEDEDWAVVTKYLEASKAYNQ